MCAHFESIRDPERFKAFFKLELPEKALFDVWPSYESTFIRLKTANTQERDISNNFESLTGSFGLIPHWSKDTKIARHTYNARIETVADKPSFKDAWRLKRLCIIPAEAIYEPDWKSGKAISTKIFRADLKPLGIAGIWTGWRAPSGEILRSFSMLTINADEHALMQRFHKPGEEKRMVAILDENDYFNWLQSTDDSCLKYIKPFEANLLTTRF
jgi:putative SOS response-associated peptidase YedK